MPSASCPICFHPNSDLFCQATNPEHQELTWEIRKCRHCGHGWTLPSMSEVELAEYYPSHYYGQVEKTLQEYFSGQLQKSRSWQLETEKVALVERYCKGESILDVGCSGASFLLALDPERWDRAGLESSPHVVQTVQRKIPELRLFQGDLFLSELERERFDVVTFWHVLEHLNAPHQVMKRVSRLLRPGGWLFVSLPNLESFQARLFKKYWHALDVPRHLHHYSPTSLECLLKQAGLISHDRLFFSRIHNIHQLKHSLLRSSLSLLGSRVPYYLCKPLLFLFQSLEAFSKSHFGIVTVVAQKPA